MALLTRIKSLLDFPLKNFPQVKGRNDDLYALRATCTRGEGYFLLKCDTGDYFESSLPLMLEDAGAYMLGRIVPSESIHRPGALYYDVYIHGGSMDCAAFCTNPEELAEMLRELDKRGMEYVFTDNEAWGITADNERPFDQIFVEFPTDLRFAIMFGEEFFTESEEDQDTINERMEKFLQ